MYREHRLQNERGAQFFLIRNFTAKISFIRLRRYRGNGFSLRLWRKFTTDVTK